jgi:hypothetical protein
MYRETHKKALAYFDQLTSTFGLNLETDLLGPAAVLPTPSHVGIEHQTPPSCDTMHPVKSSRLTVTTTEAELSLEELKKIPTDLKTIEPRADQIWNCDEIGIDPNGKWQMVSNCVYLQMVHCQQDLENPNGRALVYSAILLSW